MYHPIIDSSKGGATKEQNLEWMEKIRGSEAEEQQHYINEMIEGNIPLVLLKMETFLKLSSMNSYLWDDIVSEALLSLTQAVQALAEMETPDVDNNPSGYIGVVVVRRVGKMIEKEIEAQRIPEDYTYPTDVETDPRDEIEIQDTLYAACETSLHCDILRMRAKGCNMQEIGEVLNLSRQSIGFYLHEIREQYEEMEKNL